MASEVSTMPTDDGPASPGYILDTDYHASVRLALQHYLWKETVGFVVHPRIPKLPDHSRIADVATGTGQWLIDVGRDLKDNTHLTAFDVNLNQAPSSPWLPANMELRYWDMFEAPPDKYLETFDFVHVRFVTLLLRQPGSPEKVIANVKKLLKPGGWLQWDECNNYECQLVKPGRTIEAPSLEYLRAWPRRERHALPADLQNLWSTGFAELLKETGLNTVEQHEYADKVMERPDLMRFNTDQLLMGFEQIAKIAQKPGDEDFELLTQSIKGAAQEVAQGCLLVVPPMVWTAQKPL